MSVENKYEVRIRGTGGERMACELLEAFHDGEGVMCVLVTHLLKLGKAEKFLEHSLVMVVNVKWL